MDVYEKDPEAQLNFDYLTIVDGAVLPDELDNIFKSGAQPNVPALIGSNEGEATTFDPVLLNTRAADLDYAEALRA